jgi:hypothetical protein
VLLDWLLIDAPAKVLLLLKMPKVLLLLKLELLVPKASKAFNFDWA